MLGTKFGASIMSKIGIDISNNRLAKNVSTLPLMVLHMTPWENGNELIRHGGPGIEVVLIVIIGVGQILLLYWWSS